MLTEKLVALPDIEFVTLLEVVTEAGITDGGVRERETTLSANTARMRRSASRARFEAQRSREMIQQIGFLSRKLRPRARASAAPKSGNCQSIPRARRIPFSCHVFGASQLAMARKHQAVSCSRSVLSQKSGA